jgi:hypothetical protein
LEAPVPADLSKIAVMTTAWRRPFYFEPVLLSWAAADGIDQVRRFVIALGPTDRYQQQLALIERMKPRLRCPVEVAVQSPQAVQAPGPHRAIMEAVTKVFADPDIDFVVCGEEDVAVSSDVLTYMGWAAEKYAADKNVLAVCAHNQCGQGWDPAEEPQDGDADQWAVRLKPYFNPWGWGVWRDRWFAHLQPTWDWTVTSGLPEHPDQCGYDHNIQRRVIPSGPFVDVVPDASRSQNIGQYGGWAQQPGNFYQIQAKSFRQQRESGTYEVVTGA